MDFVIVNKIISYLKNVLITARTKEWDLKLQKPTPGANSTGIFKVSVDLLK
jgi:hypothetical protein